ncbi:hypothetical protein BDR03DRAFT_298702 [Suillus americanus]|nr:hypothetical protein BDR03DRAFT_298702 [Suillus americanus]
MRTSIIYLVILSAATTLISSRLSVSYLTQSFRAPSSPSYKKQSSSIPLQCTSTSDPVKNELNAGCPMTACCTQSFETSYYNCLLCVAIALKTTDYTQAQADLDQLYVSCNDSLAELTFPGQNPSRTLSTSSRAGTSTVVGTSPAAVLVPTLVLALRSVPASTPLSTSPTSASSPAPSSSTPALSPAPPSPPASTSPTTCISETITLLSSASPASSRFPTPAKGTPFSSTFTPTTSSGTPELNPGGGGAGLLPP